MKFSTVLYLKTAAFLLLAVLAAVTFEPMYKPAAGVLFIGAAAAFLFGLLSERMARRTAADIITEGAPELEPFRNGPDTRF